MFASKGGILTTLTSKYVKKKLSLIQADMLTSWTFVSSALQLLTCNQALPPYSMNLITDCTAVHVNEKIIINLNSSGRIKIRSQGLHVTQA